MTSKEEASMRKGLIGALMALLLCASVSPVWAQGSTQIWSGKKGASANPGALTADDVDANTRALNVILKGTNTVAGTGNFTVTQGTAANLNATVVQGTAANLNATVVQSTASSLNAQVQGAAAHDATVSGNPVSMGATSSAAAPAAVSADGEAVRVWANRLGALQVGIRDANGDSAMDESNNSLNVTCVVGCSGSTFADNSAFTFDTTVVSPMAAVVDDTGTNSVAENSAGAPRMSTSRILYGNLRTGAGVELLGQTNMAGSIPVVIANNQSAVPVSQSGTWTVQIGNTPNTTPILTIPGGGTAVKSGQASVGATEAALGSNAVKGCVVVKALLSNVIPVYVGPTGLSTADGFELQPGDSTNCIYVANTNAIFHIASTTGAAITWFAAN
jgi:hypothetical protein